MRKFYVYIVRCRDESFYIGITNNYEARFAAHERGDDPRSYTFRRRPLQLVRAEEYQTAFEAIAREKQLKGWSRRKKEALVRGDEEALHIFSKRPSRPRHVMVRCESEQK